MDPNITLPPRKGRIWRIIPGNGQCDKRRRLFATSNKRLWRHRCEWKCDASLSALQGIERSDLEHPLHVAKCGSNHVSSRRGRGPEHDPKSWNSTGKQFDWQVILHPCQGAECYVTAANHHGNDAFNRCRRAPRRRPDANTGATSAGSSQQRSYRFADFCGTFAQQRR